MNRQTRTRLAEQTLQILQSGGYQDSSGKHVTIADSLRASVEGTRLIRPSDWQSIVQQACEAPTTASNASIEITSESTLAALQRLAVEEGCEQVVALNFASAKNPGGGFLSGSQAQEESIARSSGLFATLRAADDYYQANRKCDSKLYTDHAIFSPRVPVFRHGDGELLERPYMASFITMPAVNAGAIERGSPDMARVAAVMEHRINCVLALAAAMEQRALVLGAWGCGVFQNDPDVIASLFARALSEPSSWRAGFSRIVFAVFDASADGINRLPFEQHLGRLGV